MFRWTVLLLLLSAPALAQTVSVIPRSPAPGTEILVDVGDLGPGATYVLELGDGAGGEWPLGSRAADRIGALNLSVTLPNVPAGAYQLRVLAGRNVVATADLTLVPGAVLTLTPDAAAPGETVTFSASNLPPGQYTLSLEGLRLFGPGAADGTLSGSFVVPYQRTTNPALVDIDLVGRSGRLTLVSVSEPFSILEGEGPYTIARVSDAALPSTPLARGQSATVGGRLTAPPQILQNPETRMSVVSEVCPGDALLPASIADCVMVPVSQRPVTLDADGNFSASVTTLDLLLGGATMPVTGGTSKKGLVWVTPNERSGGVLFGATNSSVPLPTKTFTIRMVKSFTQFEPLVGAVVSVVTGIPLIDPECPTGDCPPQVTGAGGPYQSVNQLQWWVSQLREFELTAAYSCPFSLARGLTDASGEFSFTITPEVLVNAASVMNLTAGVTPDINTPALKRAPRFASFEIRMNALSLPDEDLSWGVLNAEGKATGVVFRMFFDLATNKFHQGVPVPGLENLPTLPEGLYPTIGGSVLEFPLGTVSVDDLQFPAEPFMPGLTTTYVSNRAGAEPTLRFQGAYGYPDRTRFPDAIFSTVEPLEVRIEHDELTFGVLENVSLVIDGSRIAVPATAPDAGACSAGGVEYAATIPNGHRLAPGLHNLTLEAAIQFDTKTMTRDFQLLVEPGPDWVVSPRLQNPSIGWSPEEVRLFAIEPPQSLDVTADIDDYDVGRLDNDSENNAQLRQTASSSGLSEIRRFASSDNNAMNREAVPDPASLGGSLSGEGGTMQIGSKIEQVLVDSGKIPLFRYVWGIPPIADATIGADFWFQVLYRYFGSVTIGAAVKSVIEIYPAVAAGLDLFFDVSILFDIVSLEAKATPSIRLEMPFKIIDGEQTEASELFRFLLDLSYEVSVGICPVCISGGGNERLINTCEGSGCSKPATLPPTERSIAPRPASLGRTTIASNGRGSSLAAWVGEDGNIHAQTVTAGELSTEVLAVLEPLGITGLSVEWLSRDRAVMVWAQSALEKNTFFQYRESFGRRDFDGNWSPVSSEQYLRYALFENGSWSAPMDLTQPGDGGGEGGIQLAACADDPRRGSDCALGGEVLAVWTRDLDGRLAGNQRVFFSRFNGAGWSPAQPVDPGSTAKEVQPTATYIDGKPVVMWVRNPTQRLADLAQRELAYRFLNSDAVGTVPTVLSRGVASPSVAGDSLGRVIVAYSVASDPQGFIGNRRSLHLAIGDCSAQPCSWVEQTVLDQDQRLIWVQRPQLEVSPLDQAMMVFRHLGYGSLDGQPRVRAGDSFGATAGTGDLAMVTLDLETGISQLDPLTLDGALNFNVATTYDPTMGELLVTSVAAPEAALAETVAQAEAAALTGSPEAARTPTQARRTVAGQSRRLAGNAGPRLNTVGNVPDLAVVSINADAEWPDPFLPISVRVENRGAPFEGKATLELNWDGPPDTGRSAWWMEIDDPGLGGASYDFFIGFAEGDEPDEIHRLYVTLDSEGRRSDRNGSNNQLSRLFGQLPAPQITAVRTSDRSPATQIDLAPVNDPRVVGYRLYRSEDGETWLPVGTTFTHGYLDLTGDSSSAASYRATSFSARGLESDFGSAAQRQAVPGVVIFDSSFEPPE